MEQQQQQQQRFYERDVVGSIANPERVGMIDEVGNVTSGDEGESDEPLEDGAAVVVWNDGQEETVDLSEVNLVDRGLEQGDFVALVSDPLGQFGTVQSVELLVDLLHGNGEVVKDVSTDKLRPLSPFMEGDYVARENWVGRVEEVVENVTVLFDDARKCKVFRADEETLVPVDGAEWTCDYYVGMRVRAAKSVVFKTAKWLRGKWKSGLDEGTVTRVDVAAVVVYWMGSWAGPTTPTPKDYQFVKDLVHLPQFSQTRGHWRLGDFAFLKDVSLAEDGEVSRANDEREASSKGVSTSSPTVSVACPVSSSSVEAEDALRESSPLQRKRSISRRRAVRKMAKRKLAAPQTPVRVIRTQRFVDVRWQDGSTSLRAPAKSLVPVFYLNDSDFWPEIYIAERSLDAEFDDMDEDDKRLGIVKTVDAKQKTARVKWFKGEHSPYEVIEFEDAEETVSVYDILEHPDYRYNAGDVVIRLPTREEAEIMGKQPPFTEENKRDVDLAWVGAITVVDDGFLIVQWGNGEVSKKVPNAIHVVDRNDSDEESTSGEDDDAESWETADSNSLEDFESTAVEAEQPVTREERNQGEQDTEMPDASVDTPCDLPDARMVPASEQPEQATSNACSSRPLTDFKAFEMVKDASDHYFARHKNEVPNQRKWLKKVNQEWSILQKNLPETIFVVMYEDRMDLMRAAILGAAGTPYHDGVFVFDIFLPADYPSVPPEVYYHSVGLRLNPNLYENGKVCLSLLNTWNGKGTELWNPDSSNILQVLVSIQGLVLNAKPYFNEAGYDNQNGTGEGEKNSIAYNENTFLLSCKTILYLLRSPPMHFEELLRSHFRTRGFEFLTKCKAYLEGAPVGKIPEASSDGTLQNPEESNSTGFQLMLRKLMPRLATAFVTIGASECKEFETESR